MHFTRQALTIESWTLWGAGLTVLLVRMASRRIKLEKWINLGIDDYMMMFAFINFTGVVVTINQVASHGSSYMDPEDAAKLTDKEKGGAIFGSIMTFVLEIFTLTGLWTVKGCLLILYGRLTYGTFSRQHKMVKVAAVYCVLTYTLTMLLFLFYWCSPHVDEYWRVPYKYEQCATYYHHLIFATACNISSDLLLLFIPIPIIIKAHLPLRKKLILCFILGLGVFNILASVLNRYYNFHDDLTYVFLYWYVAEVGISMFVGNLPLCWPVVRFIIGAKADAPPLSDGVQVPTISSRKKRKKPRTGLTSLGDTMWDKLDDQEATMVDHQASRPPASDQGSTIELVDQKNKGHHHAAASADVPSSSTPTQGGTQLQETVAVRPEGDKIMVVTTVDVSSQ